MPDDFDIKKFIEDVDALIQSAGAEPEREAERKIVAPSNLREVRDILHSFVKAVKASKIYFRNNYIYIQFTNDLYDKLHGFLEKNRDLSLKVTAGEFLYDGNVVYETKDRTESPTFKLYKDGIRRLSFKKGLEKDELLRFLDCITIDFSRPENMEHDLASLLWESDFPHIRTIVLETFTQEVLGDEEGSETMDEEDEEALYNEVRSNIESFKNIKLIRLSKEERELLGRLTIPHELDMGAEPFSISGDRRSGSIVHVSKEEMEAIREEIERVEKEGVEDSTISYLILETLRGGDENHIREFVGVLSNLIKNLFYNGEVSIIREILSKVRLLIDPRYFPDYPYRELVRPLILMASKGENLKNLLAILNREVSGIVEDESIAGESESPITPSDIFSLFILMEKESIPEIIEMLGKIKDFPIRRAVCDALILISERDSTPFVPFLAHENWRIVSDIIYILGKIGDPKGIESIISCMERDDPKIKKEAILSLKRFQSPRIKEVVMRSLSDPSLDVRLESLRYLSIYRDARVVPLLKNIMLKKDFAGKNLNELRGIFITFSYNGENSILPFYETLLFKKKWIKRIENQDLIKALVEGIAVLETPEALRLLKKAGFEAPPEIKEYFFSSASKLERALKR